MWWEAHLTLVLHLTGRRTLRTWPAVGLRSGNVPVNSSSANSGFQVERKDSAKVLCLNWNIIFYHGFIGVPAEEWITDYEMNGLHLCKFETIVKSQRKNRQNSYTNTVKKEIFLCFYNIQQNSNNPYVLHSFVGMGNVRGYCKNIIWCLNWFMFLLFESHLHIFFILDVSYVSSFCSQRDTGGKWKATYFL